MASNVETEDGVESLEKKIVELQAMPVDGKEGESTEVVQDQQLTTVVEAVESSNFDHSRIVMSGLLRENMDVLHDSG